MPNFVEIGQTFLDIATSSILKMVAICHPGFLKS